MRELRRELCRQAGTDNPRKEDIKSLAFAIDPRTGAASFTFPRVFDLDDPQGHYQRICVPRNSYRLENFLHAALHAKPPTRKVGENDDADDSEYAGGKNSKKKGPKGGKDSKGAKDPQGKGKHIRGQTNGRPDKTRLAKLPIQQASG